MFVVFVNGSFPPPDGHSSTGAAEEVFILYTPSLSTQTYLLDESNNVVFEWSSELKAGQSAFLQKDGSIIRAGSINDIAPDNRFVKAYKTNPSFQVGGIVERISSNGDVVWSFEYYSDDFAPHHVATVMPNGNLLMPVWRYFSLEEAIALGRDPAHLTPGGVWIGSIIEVRPTGDRGGEIVWEWKAADHLIQDFDPTKANFGDVAAHPGRIDINYGRGSEVPEDSMHINSAFYIEELDQIALTSYHYSELWIIDHSTTSEEAAGSTGGRYGRGGDLLYRWGNPPAYGRDDTEQFLLSAVHDPKWIAKDRHFIMYDNNVNDPERDFEGGNSMVVEIKPPISPSGNYVLGADGVYGPSQPVWTADLGVQASAVGTAQRLPDGRTLSCDCPDGVAIWLDEDGNIITTEDLYENTAEDTDIAQVFRLVGYSKDHEGVLEVSAQAAGERICLLADDVAGLALEPTTPAKALRPIRKASSKLKSTCTHLGNKAFGPAFRDLKKGIASLRKASRKGASLESIVEALTENASSIAEAVVMKASSTAGADAQLIRKAERKLGRGVTSSRARKAVGQLRRAIRKAEQAIAEPAG